MQGKLGFRSKVFVLLIISLMICETISPKSQPNVKTFNTHNSKAFFSFGINDRIGKLLEAFFVILFPLSVRNTVFIH